MSDARLRRLERDYNSTGSPEALDSLSIELARSGSLHKLETIVGDLLFQFDLPYRQDILSNNNPEEHITHLLPFLNKDGKRTIFAFQLLSDGNIASVEENFPFARARGARFTTTARNQPITPGKLLTLTKRVAWETPHLAEIITQGLHKAIRSAAKYYGREITIMVRNSRDNVGWSSADSYSVPQQGWQWEMELSYRSTPIMASLNLGRSPFIDTLEFICESVIGWGSPHEVQGLRISGPCFQEYGGIAPDDEDDYAEYEDMDTWDYIIDLVQLQELLDRYMVDICGLM